jgi:hypothetical protein
LAVRLCLAVTASAGQPRLVSGCCAPPFGGAELTAAVSACAPWLRALSSDLPTRLEFGKSWRTPSARPDGAEAHIKDGRVRAQLWPAQLRLGRKSMAPKELFCHPRRPKCRRILAGWPEAGLRGQGSGARGGGCWILRICNTTATSSILVLPMSATVVPGAASAYVLTRCATMCGPTPLAFGQARRPFSGSRGSRLSMPGSGIWPKTPDRLTLGRGQGSRARGSRAEGMRESLGGALVSGGDLERHSIGGYCGFLWRHRRTPLPH